MRAVGRIARGHLTCGSRRGWYVLVGVLALGLTWPATAAPAPAPNPSPLQVTIRVTMEEYRFTPATIALRSGQSVRLEIQNLGTAVHQFRSRVFQGVDVYLRTPGVDLRSEDVEAIYVRPGAIATIEFVRRTTGEYDYWCSATTDGRRHRDLGMRGKFTVSP